ncbi:MFS transporter [Sneathiella chinensis]|uniref:MFS transporter n=1 Tax=Sneathiella chinensis TaxID=349750 RepID=A0ABQ5U6M3_9PROT|nr:MFS transporter [Sneathiella chinensis]GLQ06909.1 MFS transporter [Sneathiella chinensis]
MTFLKGSGPVWCLALGQTLFWAGLFYLFPALIIRWESGLGWSKAEITGALMMALVASALVSPLSGRLNDRGYGPHMLAGGGVVGGVLVAMLALVETLVPFYLLWAGIGLCMGTSLYQPCFSFLIRNKGEGAKRAITLVTLVAGFASTVSFPLNHAISELAGWRVSALAFAAMILLIGVPLMWAGARRIEASGAHLRAPDPAASGPTGHAYRFLWHPVFWLLAIGMTLPLMANAALGTHMLPLLDEKGVDPDLAILAVSFIGPMQVLGRLVIMMAERYLNNILTLAFCFLSLGAAALCLLGTASYMALLPLFIFLQGTGNGVISIIKPVVSRDLLGARDFGLKSGVQFVPIQVGSAFAAVIGSLIWEVGGYDLMIRYLIGAAGIGLALFLCAVHISRTNPLE